MYKSFFAGICLFALAACGSGTDQDGGSGGGGGGGGGGGTGTVPTALAQNVSSATYNPASNSLSLTLFGHDHPSLDAAYVRNAALDVTSADGTTTYRAYTFQENTLARQYLALFASGSHVTAGAVTTEGQFGTSFGGTTYARIDAYSRPAHGSAQYIGGYAGLIDMDPNATDDRAVRTSGQVHIRVNFNEGAEGHIEGGITNRQIIDPVPAPLTPLADLALIDTALTNGEFFGDVRIGTQVVGDYGGVLGGAGATEIAGVIVITPYTGESNIHEYGVFVLPECTSANASPNCP